jgi:hypothetical protein
MQGLSGPSVPGGPTPAGPSFGHHFDQVKVQGAAPAMTSVRPTASQPEFADGESTDPAQVAQGLEAEPEQAPGPPPVEAASPAAERGEAPTPSLIVDDAAEELGPDQMRKSEFLDELRAALCATADTVLAAAGRSAQGCPYIEYWIGYYSTRDSRYIERAIRRYAPETSRATKARDYISLISARVLQATAVWVSTGEITGVPEGLESTQPGAEAPAAGAETVSRGEGAAPPEEGTEGSMFFAGRGGAARGGGPQAIQAQLGSGGPLEGSVRARMESAFRHDFSRVRVHTDGRAAALSAGVNARALSVGGDIAFGSGEYRPGTLIGDALIAHELAHVVQQDGATPAAVHSGGTEYDLLEEDAEKSTVGVVASLWGGAVNGLSNLARNALPRLRSGLRLQRCKKEVHCDRVARPAATSCAPSFSGISFLLQNQTGSGLSNAAAFEGVASGGKHFIRVRGTGAAQYAPQITICAPDDATAQKYEVGLIQNVLTTSRRFTYSTGTVDRTTLPSVPIRDGAPNSSGVSDSVFAENGGGHPGILVGFTGNRARADLLLPDTPGDGAFFNLLDNTECPSSLTPGTLTGIRIHDTFRTWVGVRQKPTGCVGTLHHIDWETNWEASISMVGGSVNLTVSSRSIDVTVTNGDGSPSFVSGFPVPAEVVGRQCPATP